MLNKTQRSIGLRMFVVATIASMVATGAIVTIAYYKIQALDRTAFSTKHDLVQTVVATLALVLGTSCAVAGALATLTLANLGITVAERQDIRDQHRFTIERYTRCVEIYSKLVFEISKAYTQVSLFGSELSRFIDHFQEMSKRAGTPDRIPTENDLQSNIEIQQAAFGAGKAVESLISAVTDLATDGTAFVMLREKASKTKLLRRRTELDLAEKGFLEMKSVEPEGVQLALIVNLLSVNARKLEKGRFGSALQACYINLHSDVLPNFLRKEYGYTGFAFFGAICCYQIAEKTSDGRMLIANPGAAALYDLFTSIPSGSEILESIERQYDFLTNLADLRFPHFNPRDNADATFLSGIDGFAKHIDGLSFFFGK